MYPQTTDTIVMIPPNHFGFNPETAQTNAFQHEVSEETAPIRKKAQEEYRLMKENLINHHINVIEVSDREDIPTPDAVFPNNWFSTHPSLTGGTTLVLYPMLYPSRRAERQKEKLVNVLAKSQRKVTEIVDLTHYEDENRAVEGTGSIIFDRCHSTAYAALSPRTDKIIFEELCKRLDFEPFSFETTGNIYHTNVLMSVGKQFAVVCFESVQESFRTSLRQKLLESEKTIIPITTDQMNRFCANVLEVKNAQDTSIILLSSGAFQGFSSEQRQLLSQFGQLVHSPIPVIEQVEGGSARCMAAEIFTT